MNLQICVKGGERLFDHGGDGSHVKTKDTCGAFECRLHEFYKADLVLKRFCKQQLHVVTCSILLALQLAGDQQPLAV